MGKQLSNVIGAPFQKYVLDQLDIRAARNSTVQRSNQEILFLANKTAWARLISSVNITLGDNPVGQPLQKFYESLELPTSVYNTPEALAKNWILEGGTSIVNGQGIKLRQGFGPDGAYGLGGTEELGYRPMPGLTSVQVETVGRLGSLRQATISFKVWNIQQLNIIEALYFRLGYSMLLEWGHTQFFSNPNASTGDPGNVFNVVNNTFGLDDPFASGIDKMTVQQKITQKSKGLSGNYDGMFGVVSNFDWSFNQEGGYDCMVKLIGLGAIMESVRITQSYKMPPNLVQAYTQAKQSIQDNIATQNKQKEEDDKRKREAAIPQDLRVPKNFDQLYNYAVDFGGYTPKDVENFRSEVSYYPAYNLDFNIPSTVPDYFFLATEENKDLYNQKVLGLFLQQGGTQWVPLHKNPNTPFLVNIPLLNKITEVNIQGRLTDTGISNVAKSKYKTPIAKYAEQAVPPALFINADQSRTPGIFLEYTAKVTEKGLDKDFTVQVWFQQDNTDYQLSFDTVLLLLDTWASANTGNVDANKLFFKEFDTVRRTRRAGREDIIVTAATPFFTVKDVKYTGASTNVAVRNSTKEVKGYFIFKFDNTALIQTVLQASEESAAPVQVPQQANTGDNTATQNTATADQTNPAETYESALHVMLSFVKTVAQAKAQEPDYNLVPVIPIDILEATKTFFQDGILKDVFNPLPSADLFNRSPFNVTYYAQKGFNSNLMANALADPTLYGQIGEVNFKDLCKAYLVRYKTSNATDVSIEYPTYIQLGYLLAFLNNMCLIYDSKQKEGTNRSPQGSDKTPYVYIDFNPETNYCLTTPQHLSIDPSVCLIPFQGNDSDYESIFPDKEIFNKIPDPYKPSTEDFLSARIPTFKALADNAYQGRTMNILINIDFLLKLAGRFSAQSPENATDLKNFLESLVVEVNKSLGNQNLFRVAYRDDSNTIQIVDDQRVPNAPGEDNLITRTIEASSPLYGQIPVFTLGSTVRAFQFKTNVSTKLGSIIAISAQAATGSVNASDHSSFSYLNRNYEDRFKPYIKNASTSPSAGSPNSSAVEIKLTDQDNNDITLAEKFNSLVRSIYTRFDQFDTSKVDTAKNYYIECVSRTKSGDPVTAAAPFIPANLEITLDGIAGIIMGNAFTIPESRLPLSLRGENGETKVGFVVVGLSHTIQDNQWLTKIRGQMIKLKDKAVFYGKVPALKENPAQSRSVQGVGGACTRAASTAIQNAGSGFNLLKQALLSNGFTTNFALASILAIAGSESNWQGNAEENFRYSEQRLRQAFPGLTEDQIRRALAAQNRQQFFSIVYGEYNPSRVGNRNAQDGGLYYGRGFIQLTGYGNYKKYGDFIGQDLVNNPSLAANPEIAAQIVVAYYKDRVRLDINSPAYFNAAIRATGIPIDTQVKVGYYNCLVGNV